jgi:hypothetical protein
LLLNSFFARNSSTTQNINAGASSLEVLSNQLNNILAQMNLPVDVGVNFRPSDNANSSEFEFEVSRAFFNNRVLVNVNGSSGWGSSTDEAQTANQSSDFAGDVSVELKVNKQGNIRLKGFSRSNNDPLKETRDNTQGISLFYTKEFNTWRDLFKRRKANK